MTEPVAPAASSPSRLPPAENEWFAGRWGDEYDYAILAREWTVRG